MNFYFTNISEKIINVSQLINHPRQIKTKNIKQGDNIKSTHIKTLSTDYKQIYNENTILFEEKNDIIKQKTNHRIINIEKTNIYTDVYDIVNVGKYHIFGIQANNGLIFSHNSTTENEDGEILKITCNDENKYEILHNLFYDIVNISFNLPM